MTIARRVAATSAAYRREVIALSDRRLLRSIVDEFFSTTFEPDSTFQMIVLYEDLLRQLVGVNSREFDALFANRYGGPAFEFFRTKYTRPKVPLFLGLVCNLLVEERQSLVIRFEPTTNVYGHVADGSVTAPNYRVRRYMDELVRRVLGGHNLQADAYHQAYSGTRASVRVVGTSSSAGGGEREHHDGGILRQIVGATAAALALSLIGEVLSGRRHVPVLNPEDDAFQPLLPAVQLPGSVKVYGFCMVRSKRSPTRDVRYNLVDQGRVADWFGPVNERVPLFLLWFRRFCGMVDPEASKMVAQDEGAFWHVSQLFFWLLTQAFDSEDGGDGWQEFLLDFDWALVSREVSILEGLRATLWQAMASPGNPDERKSYLVRQGLATLRELGLSVHYANEQLVATVERKLRQSGTA